MPFIIGERVDYDPESKTWRAVFFGNVAYCTTKESAEKVLDFWEKQLNDSIREC